MKNFLPKDLAVQGKGLAERYSDGHPFPHIIIDDFFDPEILEQILAEFPAPNKKWKEFDNEREIKLATRGESRIPNFTRQFLYNLNSETFLNFLSDLTGIKNLISDPYFEGGGLHQILPGGKLAIHADFNKHSKLKLDRKLNILIYLNKNWKEQYGGHLELWDKSMKECRCKVMPVFNRVVIFTTQSDTYHGHPEPLACPEGMTRKSLALYYYTNDQVTEKPSHSTLFMERPGEEFRKNSRQQVKSKMPKFLRRYFPHF